MQDAPLRHIFFNSPHRIHSYIPNWRQSDHITGNLLKVRWRSYEGIWLNILGIFLPKSCWIGISSIELSIDKRRTLIYWKLYLLLNWFGSNESRSIFILRAIRFGQLISQPCNTVLLGSKSAASSDKKLRHSRDFDRILKSCIISLSPANTDSLFSCGSARTICPILLIVVFVASYSNSNINSSYLLMSHTNKLQYNSDDILEIRIVIFFRDGSPDVALSLMHSLMNGSDLIWSNPSSTRFHFPPALICWYFVL